MYVYDRAAAVQYAGKWSHGRNPMYYNFDSLGGDCTNFASQCLFAGSKVMDHTPVFGWYYYDANKKSPSWTGVEFLSAYLLRKNASGGPAAVESTMEEIHTGDILQLAFKGGGFGHTLVVVEIAGPPREDNILVASHTIDSYKRPLSTYSYSNIRYLHIAGVIK